MQPEQKARLKIDAQLTAQGWVVVNHDHIAPEYSAQAVREERLQGALRADYVLLLLGKAVGVIEAKRPDLELNSLRIKIQAESYAYLQRPEFPAWSIPLPLVFLANGDEILMSPPLTPEHQPYQDGYLRCERFLRPYEVLKLLESLKLCPKSATNHYQLLPPLNLPNLRSCQITALNQLEHGLKQGQKRQLMVLATGSGKTYLACVAIYRLLRYSGEIKRVLFLVDRVHLAQETFRAFNQFSADTERPFAHSYGLYQLTTDSTPKPNMVGVFIGTIQGLYALMGGQDLSTAPSAKSNANGVASAVGFKRAASGPDVLEEEEVPVSIVLPKKAKLAPNYFDAIITDECHRSIYHNWGELLSYFQPKLLLGLTATPIDATVELFDGNVAINYSYEQSVLDGINVIPYIYRISTAITEHGGTVQAGETMVVSARHSGKTKLTSAPSTETYRHSQVNDSYLAPDQIRVIIQEYKDTIYPLHFPEREPNLRLLPKTLIFTKNERHAQLVVTIIREVFHLDERDPLVRQITYSVPNSTALINEFRSSKEVRIAVTVTLMATGTDIRALEVLMFLTPVHSKVLYEQMRGRGVRTIPDDHLRKVTPNARCKDHFLIIDAVGVTAEDKLIPLVNTKCREPLPTLEFLLQELARGIVSDNNFMWLAHRLLLLAQRTAPDELAELKELAPSLDLKHLAQQLKDACAHGLLPPYEDCNAPNRERKQLIACLLTPPSVRYKLIELSYGYVKLLPQQRDLITSAGFSCEDSKNQVLLFEQLLERLAQEHALLAQIKQGTAPVERLTGANLSHLQRYFFHRYPQFTLNCLWLDYSVLAAALGTHNVVPLKLDEGYEGEAQTNVLTLFNFAFKRSTQLVSRANPQFLDAKLTQWLEQRHEAQAHEPLLHAHGLGQETTPEQRQAWYQLAQYIAINGAMGKIQHLRLTNSDLFYRLQRSLALQEMEQELSSLNDLILLTG